MLANDLLVTGSKIKNYISFDMLNNAKIQVKQHRILVKLQSTAIKRCLNYYNKNFKKKKAIISM